MMMMIMMIFMIFMIFVLLPSFFFAAPVSNPFPLVLAQKNKRDQPPSKRAEARRKSLLQIIALHRSRPTVRHADTLTDTYAGAGAQAGARAGSRGQGTGNKSWSISATSAYRSRVVMFVHV